MKFWIFIGTIFLINRNNFLHSRRVWVWVWGGQLYSCYPSHTRVLKLGKIHTHIQTQSKRKKTVISWWVQTGKCGYDFAPVHIQKNLSLIYELNNSLPIFTYFLFELRIFRVAFLENRSINIQKINKEVNTKLFN